MSDSDSFIDEVTEEVKREKLYALIRRYGWIAVAIVLLLVGGTAWNEYRKAQERTQAEALGDAILDILEGDQKALQPVALSELTTTDAAAPVMKLLISATHMGAENPQAAADLLAPLASDMSVSVVYRDLAALKLAALKGDVVPRETRDSLLEQIIIPGAPYRLLGLEQKVLLQIDDGKIEEAIASATSLLQETGVSVGLQQRLVQLIVALGGDVSTLDSEDAQQN